MYQTARMLNVQLSLLILLILNLNLGCTLDVSTFLNEDGAVKAKIVVPLPGQGIADGVSTLKVKVYPTNKDGKFVSGFTPELIVYGHGEYKTHCEASGSEFALCTISASVGGKKLVSVKNTKSSDAATVFFGDNLRKSSMVVKQNNRPANGTAWALIEFQVRDDAGVGKSGIRPVLFVKSPQALSFDCSVSDSSGTSQCRLRTTEAGDYIIYSQSPSVLPVKVTFTESYLKILNDRALADGTDKALIEVKSDFVPGLMSQPSNVNVNCGPVNGGKSICELTSNQSGAKTIGVTSPASISESVEVFFSNAFNAISVAPDTHLKADGVSEYQIDITLKDDAGNPLIGTVPEVEIIGSGVNHIRCEPSDSNGMAKCFVSSDEPGQKEIVASYPLIKDTLTLDFEPSDIVVVKQNSLADGKSPNVIRITSDSEVTPALALGATGSVVLHAECSAPLKEDSSDRYQSYCYITADKEADYTVKVTAPIQGEVVLTFVSSNSQLSLDDGEDGLALADNTDEINLKVVSKDSLGIPRIGMTPTLSVDRSAVNYTCSAVDPLGNSRCSLKSNASGVFNVRSIDPTTDQVVVVEFASAGSRVLSDNPALGIVNELTSVTDPRSFALIYVGLIDDSGNPIAGRIPVLDIQGSGVNTYICYPSDSTGVARCEVNSTEEGHKIVRVKNPSVADTVTINVISNVRTCAAGFSMNAEEYWQGPNLETWGTCTILSCENNYTLTNNVCVPNVRSCSPMPVGAAVGTQTWDSHNTDKTWGLCTINSCLFNYTFSGLGEGNACVADQRACPTDELVTHALAGIQTWNGHDWGICKATSCDYPLKPDSGVCVSAVVTPTLTGLLTDVANAYPDQVYKSAALVVSGLDRNIPFSVVGGNNTSIETRRAPGTWVNRGTSVVAAALADQSAGLINGDELRVVTTTPSTLETPMSVTLTVGEAADIYWNITTTNALPPSSPVLTHIANMNSFTVAWGAGGLGNGGTGGCKLQYFKDASTWTDLAGTYNCDLPQSTVSVSLPSDNWTNSFSSGVSVRLARVADDSEVLQFGSNLTCVTDLIMPKVNNISKDENCNGLWSDEDDNDPPLGGGFTIAATDVGDSSITGSVAVLLNFTCPTDQADGVQMAFGNTASPTNWMTCGTSHAHNLAAGTGTKTVYVRFKDSYGNATVDYTQSINLDQTAPAGGALAINSGASRTDSLSVVLTITCPTDSNSPIEMAYGETTGATNWEACVPSKVFNLSVGDGTKQVYARFRDRFGNTSGNVNANILLDQTGPTSSLSYANGWIKTLSLILTVSATDAGGSTPLTCSIEAQEAILSGGVPGPYGDFVVVSNSCIDTSVPVIDGHSYKLRMKARDSFGNQGSYMTSASEVKVDTVAPIISSAISSTPACNTVTVSVSASDARSGLAASAYSFDGGSTWQAASSKDFSTTSLSLGANQVKVRDTAGNIASYAATVPGSSATCYTYSWQTSSWGVCNASPYWSSWGSCSASCGPGSQSRSCLGTSGNQSRTVWCQRSDGTTVSDSLCGGGKPSTVTGCVGSCSGPSSQSCSNGPCIDCPAEAPGYRVIVSCGVCSINPGLPNGAAGDHATGSCADGSYARYTCTSLYSWSLDVGSSVCK